MGNLLSRVAQPASGVVILQPEAALSKHLRFNTHCIIDGLQSIPIEQPAQSS